MLLPKLIGFFCNIELLNLECMPFVELPIFSPVMTHNRERGDFCLRYYQGSHVVLVFGRLADLKFRQI